MSNEYKDWIWDYIHDLMFERKLIDRINKVEPNDPALGPPKFIWGVKDNKPVKYEVIEDEVEDYRFEHRELKE